MRGRGTSGCDHDRHAYSDERADVFSSRISRGGNLDVPWESSDVHGLWKSHQSPLYWAGHSSHWDRGGRHGFLMPKKYRDGGESRLSLEGLRGVEYHGKRIVSIWAHSEKRRSRTVFFTDGTREVVGITRLIDLLVKSKGGADEDGG